MKKLAVLLLVAATALAWWILTALVDSPLQTDRTAGRAAPASAPAAAASGDPAPQAPPTALPGTGSDRALAAGRVVDTRGRPLAGARVRLRSTDDRRFRLEATTPEDGSFSFTEFPASGATLSARLSRYLPAGVDFRPVARGETGVELVLAKGASLQVTVLTEDGEPAAGVQARISSREEQSTTSWMPTTDEQGKASADGLPSGSFEVSAADPALGKGAVDVQLELGEERAVELRLVVGLWIDGVVRYDDGEPVAGAKVRVRRGHGHRLETTTTADGTFVFSGLEEGIYEVEAWLAGYLGKDTPSLGCPAGTSGVELVFARGMAISGTVLDPAGEPSENAMVEVTLILGPTSSRSHYASVDGASFRIVGLPAGNVQLQATHPQHGDSEPAHLTLAAGASPDPVVLQLTEPALISGRVVDPAGAGVPEVQVTASRAEGGGTSVGTSTAEDGGFEVSPTTAGIGYRLQARKEGWLPVATEREFVVMGGAHDVVIAMARGAVLAGRTVDGSGTPLAEISIDARSEYPNYTSTWSGDDGAFRMEGLAAGTWRVLAGKPGELVLTSLPVFELAPGQVLEGIELVLGSGAGISGTVVSDTGEPLAGVQLSVDVSLGNFNRSGFARATSGEDGRFAIAGLPPDGACELDARGDGLTAAPGQELPLQVSDGDDVTVRLARLGRIFGRVVAEGGAAPDTFTASIVDPASLSRGRGQGATFPFLPGSFEIPLAAGLGGAPHLEVAAEGFATLVVPLPDYAPDRTFDVGTLTLHAGGLLEVLVSGADGEPLEDVRVWARVEGRRAQQARATGESGHYLISGLPAGSVAVTAEHARFVKTQATVEIRSSGSAPPLHLRLTTGARLWGRVLGSGGAPLAEIAVEAYDASGRGVKSTTTDAEGTYELLGLAAGKSYVRVWAPRGSGINLAHHLELHADDDLRVDFGGELTCTVSGLIRGWKERIGAPGNVRAETVPGTEQEVTQTAEVSPEGTFELEGLLPGSYLFSFGTAQTTRVEIPRAATHRVTLDLSGAFLHGVLRRADGRPVEVEGNVTAVPLEWSGGSRLDCDVAPSGGTFSCSLLPAGEYDLVAVLRGYGAGTLAGVTVGADEERGGLEILVAPAASLTVALTRPPAGSVFCGAWNLAGAPNQRGLSQGRDGRWRAELLQPGPYRVIVNGDGGLVAWADVVVDPAGTTTEIRVSPARTELRLLLRRGGQPFAPESATLLDPGGGFLHRLPAREEIEVMLPPGAYSLATTTDGHTERHAFTAPESSTPVEIVIDVP